MKPKELKKNYWDYCILCGCWYCRFFAEYATAHHSIKVPFIKMWFWFPRFLWRKTYKGIEDRNMKFQLWYGFYIWPIPDEGGAIPNFWPKIIKFRPRFFIS